MHPDTNLSGYGQVGPQDEPSEIDDHLDQAVESETSCTPECARLGPCESCLKWPYSQFNPRRTRPAVPDEAEQFKPAADEVARQMEGVPEPTERKELKQKIADQMNIGKRAMHTMQAAHSKLVLLIAELGSLP